MGWVVDKFNELIAWFHDWFITAVKWVWSMLLDAAAWIIEQLPAIPGADQAGQAFANVPASVLFFLDPFQLPFGITVVLSALTLRFLIRRLPIVG